MPVRRIEHVGLMVANLETSISFYEKVVGLQLIKRMGHPNPDLKLAFFRCGRIERNDTGTH